MRISDVTCPACKKKIDKATEIEQVTERVVNTESKKDKKSIITFLSGAHIHCHHCNEILDITVTEKKFHLSTW